MAVHGQVVFRPDFVWYDQAYAEKRQVFLRSYQFDQNNNKKKTTTADRIRRSLLRVRRLLWVKLRAARRFRRLVWSRLRRHVKRGRRTIQRISLGDDVHASRIITARDWFGTPSHF